MPVEMIRRHIQEQGNIGPEVPSCLQLEARDLQDHRIDGKWLAQIIEEWDAYIATDKDLFSGALQKLADK